MAKTRALSGYDMVNNPPHYTMGGIEVINFIDAWNLGFYAASIVKYVVRSPYKGTELEDLEKAQWYLNRLISIKKNEQIQKEEQ